MERKEEGTGARRERRRKWGRRESDERLEVRRDPHTRFANRSDLVLERLHKLSFAQSIPEEDEALRSNLDDGLELLSKTI
jgi:hypothetical protein